WYLIFHLHTGLLRYSNSADFIRIIKTNLLGHISTLILFYLFIQFEILDSSKALLALVFSFFISCSIFIFSRILVKGLFISFYKKENKENDTPVLIYGSDQNSVMIKHALENLSQESYKIIGFIDPQKSMTRKFIEQKKVYHFLELRKLKSNYSDLKIILTNSELNIKPKSLLVDLALKHHIKIITIPPAEDWIQNASLNVRDIRQLQIEDLLQREQIEIDFTSIQKYLKNKRVLITGAAGSIGSEIVKQVVDFEPSKIILCDIAESPLYEVELELKDAEVAIPLEVAVADIKNSYRMRKLFELTRPEIIFHAAAYKHVPLMENNPYEAVNTNIKGTKNLADLSLEFNVEKFVMISTDKAVNPTNIMGASKRIAEIYVQALNDHQKSNYQNDNTTQFVTTRFGNVLGSNGSVIPRFRKQIEKGGPLTVTHKDITRYFMTISEAVQLVLEAGIIGKNGEIFVFDMGSPVRLYDMALQMVYLSGLEVDKDIEIKITGLRPGEKLFEELLNDEESTLPTHHKKIRIAKTRSYSFSKIEKEITHLINLTEYDSNEEIVRQMKKIVPEFISQNSEFSKLDQISI
ncbi:MAG TPA: nucleoside-diphosphate sugar epimerase/dehydratase, partial [Chitinophagaceae bacterium]|nr:nucleoside-diphosphate sugar epimerase/dehydratase [Chitinophagaceae bacterium]